MKENQVELTREYNLAVNEFVCAREPLEQATEYAQAQGEYTPLGREYCEPLEEFNTPTTKVTLNNKDNQRKKHKLFGKMSYMVTAAISVVVIGQAANLSDFPSQINDDVWVEKDFADDEWQVSKAPESGGEAEVDSSAAAHVEILEQLPLQGYLVKMENGYSLNAKDGIIHDQYLNKFYDYRGNEIIPKEAYDELNINIDNGYIICADKIFNGKGDVVWKHEKELSAEISRHESILGSDYRVIMESNLLGIYEDVICYQYHFWAEHKQEGWNNWLSAKIVLVDLKSGEILYYGEGQDELFAPSYYSVFYKGKMPYMSKHHTANKDDYELGVLNMDGSLKVLRKESSNDSKIVLRPYSNISGGYFLATHYYSYSDISDEEYMVISAENGEKIGSFDLKKMEQAYDGIKNMYGGSRLIGKYICITTETEERELNKDYLFDVFSADENGVLKEYMVAYDKIYFEDTPYLLVWNQDEGYYYIDWNGEVLAGPYKNATIFTEEGYAAVQTQTNVIDIINLDFEVEETIYGGAIQEKEEDILVFQLLPQYYYSIITENESWEEILETGFEQGIYIYHYGKE